jgi:hypothetical protein
VNDDNRDPDPCTRAEVKFFLRIVALALLALLLPGCTNAGGEATASNVETFVAALNDDLFIGIAVAEQGDSEAEWSLVAYLCDGARVSQWFVEEHVTRETTLAAGGTRIALSLTDGGVSGTVALNGQAPQSFESTRAGGVAGLYRAEEVFDGVAYVGGWIVLRDGRQQGAVNAEGSVVDRPTLNLETGEASISAGTLHAAPLRGGGSGKVSF